MQHEVKMNTLWHNLFDHNVLIVWKPEFELGIPVVDEQHRGIVSTINSFYYGMQNQHGEDMLLPVIGMINDYTRIHFNVEEDFLKKCNFPELKHHQELHNELIHTLSSVGTKSI
jgi:hemerythrin